MEINDAVISDIPEITRIYNQNLGTASMYLTPRSNSFFENIIYTLQDNERMLVLTDNGSIIGWSLIQRYSPKEGYRFTCETSTYIDEVYRSRGYGTFLKKKVLQLCGTLGYRYVLARVVSSNEASIHYNLNLGYTIVGVQKGIGNVAGQWVDVTIMEYHFRET